MTDLPAEVTFGKVVGRFRLAVPDSADAGSRPDAQADSGTIIQVRQSGTGSALTATAAITSPVAQVTLAAVCYTPA